MSYYEAPGYSMIDHQLDPLIEVACQWIGDRYDTNPRGLAERRQATAAMIADALRVAADYLEAMGTPAEPTDVYCDACGAEPNEACYHLGNPPWRGMEAVEDGTYGRCAPHKERRAAVAGTYKGEWS